MILATILLVGGMVSLMAARVAGPFRRTVPGDVLLEHQLSLRERLVLHRHSIYTLGAVLLMGALTGAIPRGIELAGILGALAVVGVPAVYRITPNGVGFNAVVSRRWSEFEAIEETKRGLRLRGRDGQGDFTVICLSADRRTALQRLVRQRLGHRVRASSPGRQGAPALRAEAAESTGRARAAERVA